MLDEAQDTNPVVLDILQRQRGQLIYVGDRYQQIYEWRGAVNAMESIDTDASTYLTTSFRFGDAIAELATKMLVKRRVSP
ncbi:UvrD-helicase domain-containing protein [Sinorhizobium meliloti]|nr:UvrD-helicase domain-containing protein [Sinorhizobium meliloti]